MSDARHLVVVLNAPNINVLGLRHSKIHGQVTLDDVEMLCAEAAEVAGLAIDFRQTNGEVRECGRRGL